MKKRILALILGLFMAIALAGCGGGGATDPEVAKPADLTGEWTQTNPNSEDMYHVATIKDSVIEIYWFDATTDTKALYWAGTYNAPTTAEPYTWVSTNDKDETSSAMLASGDDTKEFSYENGVLSYSASAMGVTQTVKLEKQQ